METHTSKLSDILGLKCPSCHESPLKDSNSWFRFYESCLKCHYKFEREPGYFTGAIWMVNYTLSTVVAVVVAVVCIVFLETTLSIAIILSCMSAILSGAFFFPYSRAIWMYIDHRFHPVEESDYI